MCDGASNLLAGSIPDRTAVMLALRAVTSEVLELSASVTAWHRLDALRADPVKLANSGLRRVDEWIRHRRLARKRILMSIERYVERLAVLTREAARGSHISADEPQAFDHEPEVVLAVSLINHGDPIPF